MKSIRLLLNVDKLTTFIRWTLFGIAIGFVIVTALNFQIMLSEQWSGQLANSLRILPSGVFDSTRISALDDVSRLVPTNETVVVSDHGPVSQYFTKRNMQIPRGTYSEESLLDYMEKNDHRYLLVYQGASDVPDLAQLFSRDGLEKLDENFSPISNYTTEHSTIYLYKRKS